METPPTSPRESMAPMTSASAHLPACPQCGYSFTGLPDRGACPECGCAYDEQTILLKGIARGMSDVPWHRRLLWLAVAAGAMGAPHILVQMIIFPGTARYVLLGVCAAWLALTVYLVVTARSGERKGVETFVFAAGGFGACDPSQQKELASGLTRWNEVNTVRLDRKSANWHRLRLGRARARGNAIGDVRLDVTVRCDAQMAEEVRRIIQSRIEASQRD